MWRESGRSVKGNAVSLYLEMWCLYVAKDAMDPAEWRINQRHQICFSHSHKYSIQCSIELLRLQE